MTLSLKERRKYNRLEKEYEVFLRIDGRKDSARSFDISEKGVGILTNKAIEPGEFVEVQIFPTGEFFSITCDGSIKHLTNAVGYDTYKYKAGIEFSEGLKDFAIDQLIDKDEKIFSRWSMIFEANPIECYNVICDLESIPKWQKTVKSVKVHERDEMGRPLVGEINFDFILKKIRVVNKYEYFDRDFILSWKTIEGDIEAHEATYVFQKLREKRTNVVLSGFLVPGFHVPRKVHDYISNITIRNAIRDLKKVVESGKLNK